MFYWIYATLKNGRIWDIENECLVNEDFPQFGSSIEAEIFIEQNDLRITLLSPHMAYKMTRTKVYC